MPGPNLNYIGSSGYGVDSTGRYGFQGTPTQPAATTTTDYPVWDATTGKIVSLKTRRPWNGLDPMSGRSYSNGSPVADPNAPPVIDPRDPTQGMKPFNLAKNPDIAAGQQDLMTQFKKSADQAMTGFTDYLNNFRSDIAKSRALSDKALNTTGTETALTNATNQYTGNLDTANQNYQNALTQGAANARGVVTQAQNLLPMYDTAANNIEQQQLRELQGNISRYKMGTGTPSSLGGAEEQMLVQGAQNVMLPIEQQKIAQRYNILQGMSLPVEQGITGQNINYAGNFQPGIAGSRYGAQTSTANSIQGLRERVAGISQADAIAYFRTLGIPEQLMQQILSGNIQNLGALGQIESANTWQSIYDPRGVSAHTPVGYNTATPGNPSNPSRYPTSNIPGQNQPIVVGPQGDPHSLIDPATGGYRYTPIAGAPGGPAYVPGNNNYPAMPPVGTGYSTDASGNPVMTAPSGLPNYFNPGGFNYIGGGGGIGGGSYAGGGYDSGAIGNS